MSLTWRNRLILASPFITVAALLAISPSDDGPTFCPFALCTGMACPGCGMTRAASHLVRGEFGSALGYHPLVPLATVALAGGWVWYVLRLAGTVGPMPQRRLNLFLIGSAVALLVVWVARLLMGSLPPV